jgi:hypothetical protein
MGLALSALAQATTPATRYRVTEVTSPSESATCLPGYGISVYGGGVSDRGVVPGNLICYRNYDYGNGLFLPVQNASQPFIWNRTSGGTDVPRLTASAYFVSINPRGTVYGYGTSPDGFGIDGLKWTRATGFETVFTKAPDCALHLAYAVAGNAAGNIAGGAFRQDGVSEFPNEWTCQFRWAFRDALGNEIVGPAADQTPSRVNQRNVVVGQVNKSATKWFPLQNNRLVTLDQASPGFTSYALGINDSNVAVGVAGVDTDSEIASCWSEAVGMVWAPGKDGRSLPSLRGMTNSEAWAIDDDGGIYGFSSMGADNCGWRSWEANRGTIWRNFRATDINKLLAGSPGVTITNVSHVNSRGQVVAHGYRTAESLKDCPEVRYPEEGGDPFVVSRPCRDQRAYLLTPL